MKSRKNGRASSFTIKLKKRGEEGDKKKRWDEPQSGKLPNFNENIYA